MLVLVEKRRSCSDLNIGRRKLRFYSGSGLEGEAFFVVSMCSKLSEPGNSIIIVVSSKYSFKNLFLDWSFPKTEMSQAGTRSNWLNDQQRGAIVSRTSSGSGSVYSPVTHTLPESALRRRLMLCAPADTHVFTSLPSVTSASCCCSRLRHFSVQFFDLLVALQSSRGPSVPPQTHTHTHTREHTLI